jgi:hypothetical protein
MKAKIIIDGKECEKTEKSLKAVVMPVNLEGINAITMVL